MKYMGSCPLNRKTFLAGMGRDEQTAGGQCHAKVQRERAGAGGGAEGGMLKVYLCHLYGIYNERRINMIFCKQKLVPPAYLNNQHC
jgi:hypothetical protein